MQWLMGQVQSEEMEMPMGGRKGVAALAGTSELMKIMRLVMNKYGISVVCDSLITVGGDRKAEKVWM